MVVPNAKRDFFAKLDTPLSSVLCNCLQISCCIPNRTLYCTYHSTGRTAQWMELLVQEITAAATVKASPPIIPTFTLRDMVLPGSHDSGSGTISMWKPFSAAGRTQNLSLYEQLKAGIRYLDIRVANGTTGGDDVLSIWHGCLEGDNFTNAIRGINDFVQEHTNELIICEIVPEYNKSFNAVQKRHCLDIIRNTIGAEHIVPAHQIRDIIEQQSFVEVMTTTSVLTPQQRVILLIHDRFWEGDAKVDVTKEEMATQYHYGTSQDYLRNVWNDTRDCNVLFEKNLTTVQELVHFRGKLVSNQFVCTPGVGGGNIVSNVLGLCTGTNSLRPVSYACRLYGPNMLDTFLCTNSSQPWNIVTLDYVDLCPEITDFLIALNWNNITSMKILFAAVGGSNHKNTDITNSIQSHIYRNTVLFLPDPIQNITSTTTPPIEGPTSLTVAYSITIGTTVIQNCVVSMDLTDGGETTSLLISPFGYNENAMSVTITEENGTTGVVYRGKVYTTKAEIVEQPLNGTILEYNIDHTHCQFSMIP